ncbi:hypothetical protein NQ314_002889 [Rhamnusium bicolor]|uniref:Organic cation transporter protein-like n=1 Tax=Rhamnusium bicolor TaxID=1586634 RepID=A0AAV8ZNB6_9CUCU|nr:hypothetical protein NQ314_002889 [Rhamnusium bicolor]
MSKLTIDASLDAILVQVGDFGKYQIYVFILVCIPVILHSAVHVAYVFTAMDLNYRCEIPACESGSQEYNPPWLINAVPHTDGTPEKCEMYVYNSTEVNNGNCSSSDFDRDRTSRCSSFVYKTHEESIVQEYNLQCGGNLWKLTLVGTINSVGQFSGLFVAGMLSDRQVYINNRALCFFVNKTYGRRVVMVWGMIICAICGFIRTVMPSYELFLLLEYLDAAFSAGTYICGFVLAVELVGPKKRVLTGSLVCCGNALGSIFTATSAWIVQSWRWNIKKGRIEEAKATLRKLARVNGKELTEKTLDALNTVEQEKPENERNQFIQALKSLTLLLRFINCCFCWMVCAFVFYGLSLNSVSLAAGNRYLNFILTALVEIPAQISCTFVLSYFGRRKSVSGSFILSGASCIAFIFIPSDMRVGSLSVYLLGKFAATISFTSIYVLTSEMFPTITRHSFMGACSTFGRFGLMIAPQMPLLADIWTPLPLVCFSGVAIIAGCLTLLFPETLNIKLPDTIEEAENISKPKKKLKETEELTHKNLKL